MELLQLQEQLRAEEASIHRLFGDAGQSVRKYRNSAAHIRRMAETARFMEEVCNGKRPMHHLKEALTTSDFPLLFGDVIDRQMLGYYQEAPYTWSNYCRRATVPDFRTVKRFAIDGSEAVLPIVAQEGPYPESKLVDTKYSYSVVKHGRRVPFAWETMINDDLDALKDIPMRMGKSARRSEEKFATTLFVSSTGPNATFYSSGNKNIVNYQNAGSPPYTTANPALSVSSLAQALVVLAAMQDADGEPISVEAVELVVPPALGPAAKNILNATQLLVGAFGQTNVSGENMGSSQMVQMFTANWLQNNIRLSINYYLPIVDTTHGNTGWYLFASPQVGRPALEMGFLRGHESPEIFMRSPNAQRVGVGGEDPMNGSFDTDSIDYKIRHVFGGTLLDPKASVASNGSGGN